MIFEYRRARERNGLAQVAATMTPAALRNRSSSPRSPPSIVLPLVCGTNVAMASHHGVPPLSGPGSVFHGNPGNLEVGRPSIDPELMIRMLIVGYCYGIRSERRLCEEVEMHLAYRWFCRLDLDDRVPDHSTFSVNRHGRFRSSNIFRQLFEAVVRACMDAGLVQGEGFAIDASVIEANASRYHGKTPDEIDWSAPERQTRAVVEFLSAIDDDDPNADRKLPKVISPVDPCSAWTAKANKRVQFGYGLNYLIDTGPAAVILDVEATPARTYDEVAETQPMLERTETTFGLKPNWLAGDTAYGVGRLLAWLWEKDITPHIPVWERYERTDGMFSRHRLHLRRGARRLRLSEPPAFEDHGNSSRRPRSELLSQSSECRVCELKEQCTRAPFRKIARDINEEARDHARALVGTPEFEKSRDERKKIEMRFAHLKVHHHFERMRLRGLTGARDEFQLAATVQNLKTIANHLWRPPPNHSAHCEA